MENLDTVEWEACLLEPVRNPETERFLRKTVGIVPPGARYFLDSPWLCGAVAGLGQMPMLYLSADLGEMVALVVSQDNSCRYCYTATRGIMKILGFPERRIRRLEEDFLAADLNPAETLALTFARRVSRAAPLAGNADIRSLVEVGYSPAAAKEIALAAASNVFMNRLSTLLALPPTDADLADRWWVRVFRPLIAQILRRRAAHAIVLSPEQRQGPFAEFVNAFDGLPAAPRLRSVLDQAWRSPALPARVKAFVFAVVARGIACVPAEREAVRLLLAEGMTSEQIEPALAHLAGPDLDPLEQSAVALARESIWYRPAPLQRLARSISTQLTRLQFVELVGATALANAVCRLSVALEPADSPA